MPLHTKICCRCFIDKPASEFGPRSRAKDGLSYHCKKCACVGTKRSYNKLSARVRRDKSWKNNLKRTKDLTPDEYQCMCDAQNNRCAICQQPEAVRRAGEIKRLAVDHDHKTDMVRKLLCQRCNLLIGQADDSIELLEAAIAYLRLYALTH